MRNVTMSRVRNTLPPAKGVGRHVTRPLHSLLCGAGHRPQIPGPACHVAIWRNERPKLLGPAAACPKPYPVSFAFHTDITTAAGRNLQANFVVLVDEYGRRCHHN